MNVRDKLLTAGISVPLGASRYHTENGCMVCLHASPAPQSTIMEVRLSRQQYETLMCAGLAGRYGFELDAPYEAPPARFI